MGLHTVRKKVTVEFLIIRTPPFSSKRYDGEIVQCVVTQKLVTCIVYTDIHTYIHR